jgi:DNA polymerase III epsilon subunit-like protein
MGEKKRLKKPELYFSVDVEASGPIPGEFSLLSVGACVVGHSDQSFYCEIKPLNDAFIERAMDVNTLSMEELKIKGEQPAQAMARFEDWVKQVSQDQRPVFVAFNATFDWSFTHWYFMKFLGRDPFGISGLDIKAYYMGKRNVRWGETTKRDVRSFFTTTKKHTHNAVDDACEQAEIFEQMLNSNL